MIFASSQYAPRNTFQKLSCHSSSNLGRPFSKQAKPGLPHPIMLQPSSANVYAESFMIMIIIITVLTLCHDRRTLDSLARLIRPSPPQPPLSPHP